MSASECRLEAVVVTTDSVVDDTKGNDSMGWSALGRGMQRDERGRGELTSWGLGF